MAIALAGLSLAFQFPGFALRGYLEGCQDYHLANAVDIAAELLRAGITLMLLLAGFNLLAVIAVFPVIALARLTGLHLAAHYSAIGWQPQWSQMNMRSMSQIREFTTISFLDGTFMRWFLQADKLLAARLLPLPSLAILAVARRIPLSLQTFCSQPFFVTYPMVSSADALGNRAKIQKFVFLSTRILLAITLPLATCLWAWGDVILRLWIGEEVAAGITVFRIFVVFAFFATMQEVPLVLLYGVGKIGYSAAVSAIMLVAGVVAGTWASLRSGLEGFAVAFTVVQAIGTIMLFVHALPVAGVRWDDWFRKSFRPVLHAWLPVLGWLVITSLLFPRTLAGLILSIVPRQAAFVFLIARIVVKSETPNWKVYMQRLLLEIE